jgi:hypothetical protein
LPVVITSAGGNQHMARYNWFIRLIFWFLLLALFNWFLSLVGFPETSGFIQKSLNYPTFS